jgi:hypothetical protein
METNTHIITLQEAETLTHAYQNAQQFQGLTIASLTNSSEVIQLLNQPGCCGLRVYFALNSLNQLTVVLVGSDSNGYDMTNGVILNKSELCPADCFTSPLISQQI